MKKVIALILILLLALIFFWAIVLGFVYAAQVAPVAFAAVIIAAVSLGVILGTLLLVEKAIGGKIFDDD